MKEQIIDQLKTVYDPEITSINIFDLGLVYDIDIKDKDVTITHTLTSMFCPMAEAISESIKQAVMKVEGVGEVKVKPVSYTHRRCRRIERCRSRWSPYH